MYKLYINGTCETGAGDKLDVTCPATGELLETISTASIEQADRALEAAQAAFPSWSRLSLNERIGWMMKLKDACLAEKTAIIDLMAKEGGKSYKEAGNDFNAFIGYFGYYAEEAKRVYGTDIPEYGGRRGNFHVVLKRPVGVVLGHLAWNMPLSNVGLKLCPAMASGCTCVLKPSTETPLASLKIGELCEKIGLPAGVVNLVTGKASVIGNHLSQSKIPAMVAVIGSSAVGVEVMQNAATSIKRFSMELGGNAPCIVMPDCDLEETARYVADRKIRISGQGCANINRIFVHESIHEAFVEKLLSYVEKIQVGWSDDMPDAMGPMINVKTRDRMISLVEKARGEGAKLLYGGGIPQLPESLKNGAFFVPAVLDGVTDEMSITQQEIFGPIYAVLTFKTLDEVIERANKTELGLTGYLFTHDSRVIGRCVEEVEVGELQVNQPGAGPNMPHIGIKQSGLGCDRGKWSLEEYYDIRRISIQP